LVYIFWFLKYLSYSKYNGVQRSLYPLFPATEGTQISMANSHGFDLQITPDILILPSQLNPFAKRAGDVLCINPGRLTKGATAGTFACATIHPIIRNICSRTTRTKASDVQVDISQIENGSDSPEQKGMPLTDVAVENSVYAPHRLATDFDAVVDSETNEDSGKSLELVCNQEEKIVGNEQLMKTELIVDGPPEIDDTSAALKIIHPVAIQKRESFEELSSCSGDLSQPILHRVLERTRVDIIRL
jgi:hypothetical protein